MKVKRSDSVYAARRFSHDTLKHQTCCHGAEAEILSSQHLQNRSMVQSFVEICHFCGIIRCLMQPPHSCVCAPCSHRDPVGLWFFFSAGGCRAQWRLHPTKLSTCAEPDQLCVPAGFLTFPELSLTLRRLARYVVTLDLRVWPSFLLKTSRLRCSLLVLLGNGTLGRRVAPLSVQYTLS